MNIINNQRYKSTEEKIQNALFSLLKFKKYDEILIKEICYEAGINRSSFYSHYSDINDLMIKTETMLSNKIFKIFDLNKDWNDLVFISLFKFLKENKEFYNAYLQSNTNSFMERNDFLSYIKAIKSHSKFLSLNNDETIYHMAFFAGGLKALCKSWIAKGCKESPEQMCNILKNEYNKNFL